MLRQRAQLLLARTLSVASTARNQACNNNNMTVTLPAQTSPSYRAVSTMSTSESTFSSSSSCSFWNTTTALIAATVATTVVATSDYVSANKTTDCCGQSYHNNATGQATTTTPKKKRGTHHSNETKIQVKLALETRPDSLNEIAREFDIAAGTVRGWQPEAKKMEWKEKRRKERKRKIEEEKKEPKKRKLLSLSASSSALIAPASLPLSSVVPLSSIATNALPSQQYMPSGIPIFQNDLPFSTSVPNAKPKPMVGQTKDAFIESIERLSRKHRLTQKSMATALGLPYTSLRTKAKEYDVNLSDYKMRKTNDAFIESIERLSRKHRLTQKSMATALGLPYTSLRTKAKEYDVNLSDYKMRKTNDAFIESIERLSSEHRSTQKSMATALGLTITTFRTKAKEYDVNLNDYKMSDYKKRKRAEVEKQKEQDKSERKARWKSYTKQTELRKDGLTFVTGNNHKMNVINTFRTEVLKNSMSTTDGLSGAIAKDGTDLSSYGMFKVKKAYDEATASSIFDQCQSIKNCVYRYPNAATSSLRVRGEFSIKETTQLPPFLAHRVEVAETGTLFGNTKAYTDNLKVQKYKDLQAEMVHSDTKFAHFINKRAFGIPKSSFLFARVLEKPGGGLLKWIRKRDGKEFSIRIEKGELLIMTAHAGLCNHMCEEGLYTIVTDFVLPYKVHREMEINGGLDQKLETMIGDFVTAISQ